MKSNSTSGAAEIDATRGAAFAPAGAGEPPALQAGPETADSNSTTGTANLNSTLGTANSSSTLGTANSTSTLGAGESTSSLGVARVDDLSRRQSFLALAVLTIISSFIIFVNIAHEPLWRDEYISLLRAKGVTTTEAKSQITGRLLGRDELLAFFYIDSEFDPKVVKQILTQPREPLFNLGVYLTHSLLGVQFEMLRLLSAVAGVACVPAIYFMSMTLFNCRKAALAAAALVAVSQLNLDFAHDIRAYSWWTLLSTVSTGLLVRATVRNTISSWSAYAACSVLSLYTHAMTVLVLAGQACYVLVTEKLFATAVGRRFVMSMIAVGVAFLPLAYFWIPTFGTADSDFGFMAHARYPSAWALIIEWLKHWAYMFQDDYKSLPGPVANCGLIYTGLLLVWFSYAAAVAANKRQRILIISIFSALILSFFAADLCFDGSRSAFIRYKLPAEMLLVALVGYAATLPRKSKLLRVAQHTALGSMVVFGLASCYAHYAYPGSRPRPRGPEVWVGTNLNKARVDALIECPGQYVWQVPVIAKQLDPHIRIYIMGKTETPIKSLPPDIQCIGICDPKGLQAQRNVPGGFQSVAGSNTLTFATRKTAHFPLLHR